MIRRSKVRKAQEEGDWPSIVELSHNDEKIAIFPNYSLKVISYFKNSDRKNIIVCPIEKDRFIHVSTGKFISDVFNNYSIVPLLEVCEDEELWLKKSFSLREIRQIETQLNKQREKEYCL